MRLPEVAPQQASSLLTPRWRRQSRANSSLKAANSLLAANTGKFIENEPDHASIAAETIKI